MRQQQGKPDVGQPGSRWANRGNGNTSASANAKAAQNAPNTNGRMSTAQSGAAAGNVAGNSAGFGPGRVGPGVASNGGAPAMVRPAGSRLEQAYTVLNLTPEQKAKAQPIIDGAKPKLQAIREDAMSKSKAVFDGTKEQLKSILTEEQQKKLDGM